MLSAVLFHGCLGNVEISEETRRKLLYPVADPGEGIKGLPPPLDQTEVRRAEKVFFCGDRPPYLRVLDGRPPPPAHLKVWKSLDPAMYSEPFSDSGSTKKSVFFERLICLAP